MLKIFLTGGTGFIGRRLTKSLFNRGREVTVLVRNPDSVGAKAIQEQGAVEHQRKGAPIVIVCPAMVIGPGDHSNLGYLSRMYIRGMLPPVLYGEKGGRKLDLQRNVY